MAFIHRLNALVDSILMRTGKCGKYQLTGIGVSRVDIHLTASFINLDNIVDALQVKLRIYALREHVVGNGQNIHVTGALTVTE